MKTMRVILAGLLVALMGYPAISQAEDIDIYSGTTSNGVPNLMFVVDNPSSQNNNASACTYWDGTAPSNNNKALGQDQCALANIVHGLSTNADGSAVINLGITTVAGVYFKLTPINDSIYAGTDAPPGLIAGTTTNRQAFILAVKALAQATGKSGQGSELQETWAYYTGGNGGTTGTGILSLTDYSGAHTTAPTSCAKNYIIYLSNVDNANASHPQQWDATEWTKLTASISNAVANGTLTSAQGTTLGTKLPNMPAPIGDPGEGREWARFMRSVDVNTTTAGTGLQSVITYSVATGFTAVPPAAITREMENYIKAVASYGGGKYYPAGDDSSVLTSSILKILNEVQAVNSVFSSSSLPVSVNAQGTYLNQIYMGMFRPDPDGNPRWVGNLKQYSFVATRDPVTHLINLSLGDSLGAAAINPATGFITPNAVSYWTCGGSPSVRACSPVADVTGGFWVNDALKIADSAGGAYDLPDGEWVDKGGAAQIVRLANLTDNYATEDATNTHTRKLYTCTGTCSATSPNNLLSSYLFANSNASLTPASFGIVATKTIDSLTRDRATATAHTTTAHGLTTGQVAQISSAAQGEYNGSFVMTVTGANTFTYTVGVSPASPASSTGAITANVPAAGVNITSLTRSGSTVTVTAAGSGLVVNDSVNISGVTPTDYNGTWLVTGVSGNDFTFTGPAEGPTTPSGGGTAAVSGKTTRTIATATANPDPGFVRVGTLVTVKTIANHDFATGDLVTIAGAADSGYNIASRAITVPAGSAGNRTFTYTLPCTTPCSPATVLGTASKTSGSTLTVNSLTRTSWVDATTATVTATTTDAHGLTGTPTISISGAAQSQYNGTFTAAVTGANTFTYPITTAPATPATGSPILGSSLTAPDLINWVRGEDSGGDEFGPGGSVTIRPSLHGDVLHSRPVTVNYGGATVTITDTADSGTTRTATASAADVAKIGAMGALANITFANGNSCTVTVASSTTFTYPTTGCGAAGAQTAATGSSNVVLFYGGNDGVYRAVNGNQTNPAGSTLPAPGSELWGFIPTEFFSTLKRLHDNSPILDLPSTIPGILPTPQKKNYFADGSTGVYQKLNANGTTNTAYLYISMRRGGRLIYALDVTDPTDPKYLWKITNTGDFTELGQTWSAPKVALIKGYNDGSGNPKPVLIFGAGYDAGAGVAGDMGEDSEPAGTKTMGRGIYIADAVTGALVWRATYGASSACTAVGISPATCTVAGMNYSIPADITLMDRDFDGMIDRLYAVDVGGNVWRVDLQREGNLVHNTPDYWRVNQVASLGGSCCPRRKFFYSADVVPTTSYDAVLVGSGDREHPLYTNAAADKQDRVFMLKDLTGNDGSSLTTLVKADLFDATSTAYDATASSYNGSIIPNKGYFIDLLAGEKVVNAPLTVAGYTYFGTNQPTAALTCSANLGIARGYRLSPLGGTYTSTVFSGGGLPPSPVAGVVSVTVAGETTPSLVPFIIGGGGAPDCVGVDCTSALGGAKPTISVPTSRTRTYWYQEID